MSQRDVVLTVTVIALKARASFLNIFLCLVNYSDILVVENKFKLGELDGFEQKAVMM